MKIGYSNQGFGFNRCSSTVLRLAFPPASFPMAYRILRSALTATNFDPGAYPNIGSIQLTPKLLPFQTTAGPARFFANNLWHRARDRQEPVG